jgi:hypothetical protein
MQNKNKTKLIYICVTLLVVSIVGGLFYYKTVQQPNSSKADKVKGTDVKYEDGKVSERILNEDYKNKLFPNLVIPVEGTSFRAIENDRNKEGEAVNYILTLKKDPTNLSLTFYSDNNGRDAGATCLVKSDILDISNGWFREKLKSQDGKHIGFNYLYKPNYITPNSDQFKASYKKYRTLKENNKQTFLEANQVDMCDFVHRVTETPTILKQKNGKNSVFVRLMVDKVLPDAEQKVIDQIISKTKI